MYGSRPLIERITQRHSGFSPEAFEVPFQPPPPMPAAQPTFVTPPPSPVDQMIEPPPGTITFDAACSAISTELASYAASDDADALRMIIKFDECRRELGAFLSGRKGSRLEWLHSEDERLTREGRAVTERIDALKQEQSRAAFDWNSMQEPLSELRARLNTELASSPGDPKDDGAFILSEEVEAWKARVAQAKEAVQKQQAAMAPLWSRIGQLEEQINAEIQKLEAIHHERLQTRDELAGCDRRGPLDTGLMGRTGHARLNI